MGSPVIQNLELLMGFSLSLEYVNRIKERSSNTYLAKAVLSSGTIPCVWVQIAVDLSGIPLSAYLQDSCSKSAIGSFPLTAAATNSEATSVHIVIIIILQLQN